MNQPPRSFEWFGAALCLTIGLQVFFIPEAVGQSRFKTLFDFVTPETLAVYAVAVGASRLMALHFHGNMAFGTVRTCAAIRAAAALLCAGLWFQLEVALITNSNINQTAYSVGVPVYFWLTMGDLYSTYRAGTDVFRG